MTKVILADNQDVWRAGAARILSVEDYIRIVAQLKTAEEFREARSTHQNVVFLFSSSLGQIPDLQVANTLGNRYIALLENYENARQYNAFPGVIRRDIEASQLIRCVRLVGMGETIHMKSFQPQVDEAGLNLIQKLTPREKQISALIAQAYHNKDIATRLGTTEQVVKNYLREIYDKTGTNDRLELALYVHHHPVLHSDCMTFLAVKAPEKVVAMS